MKQPSLLDCPQEVQLKIAGFLPPADLANLCMASRSTCNVAQPLIYSTVQISWVRKYHAPIVQSLCFLRTLLESPGLCIHVRSLQFHGDGYVDSDNPPEPGETPEPPLVPALPLDRLVAVIKRTSVTQKSADIWIKKVIYSDAYAYLDVPESHDLYTIRKVQRKWADGMMAILLCLLPRLSRFSASTNWSQETRTLEAMFRLSLCPVAGDGSFPRLHSLRDVSIASTVECSPNLDPENTAEALSTFYLPDIRTLSVSIDNPVEFTWPGPLPPNPAFLTSLDIYRLRECHLAPILSVTTALKSLRYNWFYRPDLDDQVSTETILLDAMTNAFLKVSNTLEELRITAWVSPALSQGDYEDPEVTFQGSLSQLSRMSRLKILHVPWVFLIGSATLSTDKEIGPALPGTLQHLTLARELLSGEEPENRDRPMVLALEQEIESGALSNATSLKSICLPQSVSGRGWSQECRDRMKALESRSGLSLTFDTSLWTDELAL